MANSSSTGSEIRLADLIHFDTSSDIITFQEIPPQKNKSTALILPPATTLLRALPVLVSATPSLAFAVFGGTVCKRKQDTALTGEKAKRAVVLVLIWQL